MRVFVWKSYGNISVYSLETDEQKLKLKKEIVDVLNLENITIKSSWQCVQEAISDEIMSKSDDFEYGTGFYMVYE
jgi:hypothetical protein